MYPVFNPPAKFYGEKGEDFDIPEVYICPVCRYTRAETPPDKCPVYWYRAKSLRNPRVIIQ